MPIRRRTVKRLRRPAPGAFRDAHACFSVRSRDFSAAPGTGAGYASCPLYDHREPVAKCRIVWLLIGSYLLLVFVLPVALSVAVSYRALPVGKRCPQCGGDTLQLLAPALRRLSSVLPSSVQRRWCLCCGWEGAVRLPSHGMRHAPEGAGGRAAGSLARTPSAAQPPPAPHSPGTGRRSEPLRHATQTLDVRSLTLNGTAWRVMLQCWSRTGRFYGRFVFVAPSGRLWLDPVEAITGTSEDEVLGQALALSDGLLARRLRKLVTDD
jgi:hypothetical protein